MGEPARSDAAAHRALDEALRASRAALLAGLIRRAGGDFERAEDALHDAAGEALAAWPARGVPEAPAAWLATVAARRLVDGQRRATRERSAADDAVHLHDLDDRRAAEDATVRDARLDFGSDDDRLRLMFTCCHPALSTEAHVALTLNAVSGLDPAAIARAFLAEERTLAQRLTRAKRKIRDAGIPFAVPSGDAVSERLPAVLRTVQLVFNEGYTRTRGPNLTDADLCAEALRLARSLHALLPHEADAAGLLAELLLTDARRAARVTRVGDLVRLADQDRSLWDRASVSEGVQVLTAAVHQDPASPYVLRAALAAEHSTAPSASATRWTRIVELYDALLDVEPSPVIALNRAVAIGEASGPEAELSALDEIAGELDRVHYLHVARGDALARLGRTDAAREAFERALELVENDVERAYVLARRRELG